MPIAWHRSRRWDFYMPEDEKKNLDPMVTEEL